MARNLTEAEKKILLLKGAVADLAEECPMLRDDLYLLRWLKARDLNVIRAEIMIRRSLKWREEEEERLRHVIMDQTMVDYLCKSTPKTLCRDGTILDSFVMSQIDVKWLLETYKEEQLSKYVWTEMFAAEEQNIKWNRKMFEESGSDVITEGSIRGNILFGDAKNVSLRQISSLKALRYGKKIAETGGKYIPCLNDRNIVINCPKFAVYLAKIFRPIVETKATTLEI